MRMVMMFGNVLKFRPEKNIGDGSRCCQKEKGSAKRKDQTMNKINKPSPIFSQYLDE